jgi:hypothetical protein
MAFFMYPWNGCQILLKTGRGDFHQMLSLKYDFQPYRSIINPGLQKVINGIFNILYKLFHTFCWNSIWIISTTIYQAVLIFSHINPEKSVICNHRWSFPCRLSNKPFHGWSLYDVKAKYGRLIIVAALYKGSYIFYLFIHGRQSMFFYVVGQLPVQLVRKDIITCFRL